jgi:hypothetical protein
MQGLFPQTSRLEPAPGSDAWCDVPSSAMGSLPPPPQSSPSIVDRIPGWANRAWTGFRRWPTWAQVLGWLVGFWLLLTILAWRSTLPVPAKWVVTGGAVVFLIAVAASGGSPSSENAAGTSPSATLAPQSTAPASLPPPSTATPTQTPTPTPQDVLKARASDVLSGETNYDSNPLPRLRDVRVFKGFGGWVVLVNFNANNNLTTGLVKGGIELDMQDIYKAVYTSGLPISYAATSAFFPVTDKFGNRKQGLVYETRLDGKVGKRINWDNTEALDFSRLWHIVLINQSFR